MRSKILPRLLFWCALLASSSLWAWNATGHEVVADIAWDNLTPDTKAKVTALLRQHPDYARALTKETIPAGPEKDKQAFMVAATWPDMIRSASFGKSHLLAHSNWHYADTPYVIGNVKPPAAPNMNWAPGDKEPENAIQAIRKNAIDLRNNTLSPSDRAIALCWVEHLIGDIHQPLHAVSRYTEDLPDGDRGGNSFTVRTEDRTSNLHSLWDGMLGGFMEVDAVEKIGDKLEKIHPRKEFEKELAATDPDQWAAESLEQAKHTVYLDNKLPGLSRGAQSDDKSTPVPLLPADYLENGRTLAARNGALAGYRLADALNNILAKTPLIQNAATESAEKTPKPAE